MYTVCRPKMNTSPDATNTFCQVRIECLPGQTTPAGEGSQTIGAPRMSGVGRLRDRHRPGDDEPAAGRKDTHPLAHVLPDVCRALARKHLLRLLANFDDVDVLRRISARRAPRTAAHRDAQRVINPI